MAKGDLADYSDSDEDDPLLADIQAISKACLHTTPEFDFIAADSSDSDDDLEFLRSVQLKYGGGEGGDPGAQSSQRPDFGLPVVDSDSDDDDDFETLRAIERRFGRYSASGTNCGGVGDAEGMVSNSDLNSPVDGILDARVAERFDGNVEGFCDSAPKLGSLGDGAEKEQSRNAELPKAALAFIDAIKKNRIAQKHLRSQMTKVDARMEKVKEMIKGVKVIWEFDVKRGRKMTRRKQSDKVQLIAVACKDKKVASVMKKGPNENPRVENYRIAFDEYPQWINKERWTKQERADLKKGVIQQFQKWLVEKSMDRMIEYKEGPGCSYGVDEVMSKIGDLEVDPQKIRSFLPNIKDADWEDLASSYVPKRSGLECLARWINFEDPLIKRGDWTTFEDKLLLHYIQQMGHNWAAVAEALGTNRTPFQCLTRYQRSLNPSLIKRDWTPAEDAALTAAVQTYGESHWTIVASTLEGRTGPQCSNRWLKTLLPSKQRKGRWNPDEDKRLKIAVMLMGSKCWNKIAEFVPGRTQARCRDRWVNSLDPSLNLGKWTAEEDVKLEEAVRVHGWYCWAKVATCVAPRTDSQCRRRWRTLFPDDALRAQVERKVSQAALPSNFVDREPNRPSLGANDFVIPLSLEYTVMENADKRMSTRSKKSRKISDTAFCNIPKKSRSSRRCRREDICWEVPVLHRHHSSERTDILPSKRRKARGRGFKLNKCAGAELTLADLKRSLKGDRKKRRRGVNETTSRCNHAEVEVQRESSVNRDEDAGSVCTGGSVVKGRLSSGAELDGSSVLIGEEHQQEYSSVGSVSELVNYSDVNSKHHDGDETIVDESEVTRKQPKRRKRLDPAEPAKWETVPLATLFGKTAKYVEPEDWENVPLATLFRKTAKLRKRKL